MSDSEIQANAESFRSGLIDVIRGNFDLISSSDAGKLDAAYARLTCLQAIRSYIIQDTVSEGALGFYTEMQSDALTSQVLIMTGASRSALKSLRSVIENFIRSIYYTDHPIEYRQWEIGKHRPTFKSFFDYFETHPDLVDRSSGILNLSILHATWKELSQAVHASAKTERMSDSNNKISIWTTTRGAVGKWASLQSSIIKYICLTYALIYHEKLAGASLKPLRESIAIAIPTNLDAKLKTNLSIKIPRS